MSQLKVPHPEIWFSYFLHYLSMSWSKKHLWGLLLISYGSGLLNGVTRLLLQQQPPARADLAVFQMQLFLGSCRGKRKTRKTHQHLLRGITAQWGTEMFCLPPGQYGSSLFLNKKENLGADPLWCNWGAGDRGARAGPVSLFPPCPPKGASQLHKISLASPRRWWKDGGRVMNALLLPDLHPASRAVGPRWPAPWMIHVYNLLLRLWEPLMGCNQDMALWRHAPPQAPNWPLSPITLPKQ